MNHTPSAREDLIAQLPAEGPLFGAEAPSGFERMTAERFHALALWGLPQEFRRDCLPASFWSADAERLLAAAYQMTETSEAGLVVLARDAYGRFRPVGYQKSMPTIRAAEDAIRGNFGRSALALEPEFKPLEDQPPGTDLFAPIAGVKALNPAFRYLREGINQRAARELLVELARWAPDLDGNLARDFQTTGYSARVWELYLLFAFREMNFALAHAHQAPDFHLRRDGLEIFVEATTANAADPMQAGMGKGLPSGPPEDFWGFIEKEMPLKFGSPLHSKMQKRYWDLAHVQGRPLVLAVADFHAPASMIWSHTAIPVYLYGRSAYLGEDEAGNRRGEEKRIEGFPKGPARIVPFFEQPDTEHISAVLFSNAGTISKFNRMGARAGFGDRFVRLRRIGGWNDPHPDAYDPIPFDLDVESALYDENWADELGMYHNPRAHHPVADEAFPGIVHFRIEDGEAIWRGPARRVLFSHTRTVDLLGREIDREGLFGTSSSE